jgi:hypothetical protein
MYVCIGGHSHAQHEQRVRAVAHARVQVLTVCNDRSVADVAASVAVIIIVIAIAIVAVGTDGGGGERECEVACGSVGEASNHVCNVVDDAAQCQCGRVSRDCGREIARSVKVVSFVLQKQRVVLSETKQKREKM